MAMTLTHSRWVLATSLFALPLALVRTGDTASITSQYIVADIGTFGGGASQATALNAAGQVTGWALTANGERHGFLFSDGVTIDLGTLGGQFSEGVAINASGEVTGTSSGPSGREAFLYTHGLMRGLDTLDGESEGRAINSAGQVTGALYVPSSKSTHPFLYSKGVMRDLGTLAGGDVASTFQSTGNAINDSGQVTGAAVTADGRAHAFLYTRGVMHDLGTLGGISSTGLFINDAGDVTGTMTPNEHVGWSVFLYTGGVMRLVGTLGGWFAAPYGLNAFGQIVGVSNRAPGERDNSQRGFLYAGGVMIDLTSGGPGFNNVALAINRYAQITGYGYEWNGTTLQQRALLYGPVLTDMNSLILPDSGWILEQGTAINDKAQIAGFGNINGQEHAFLMTPASRIPGTKDDCKGGWDDHLRAHKHHGWEGLARANGSAFRNQGDCVSYVNTRK